MYRIETNFNFTSKLKKKTYLMVDYIKKQEQVQN